MESWAVESYITVVTVSFIIVVTVVTDVTVVKADLQKSRCPSYSNFYEPFFREISHSEVHVP